MIADSKTATPLFISDEPDRARPMALTTMFSTSTSETRNEGRQRARWRKQPRYAFAFVLSALTVAEFSARRSLLIGELQAPIVVPIWTDEFELVSVAGAVATFGATLAKKKFKVGSYAYFTQGASKTFFKIVAVAGATITLDGSPSFTAGAIVYPCILGFRPKNSSSFMLNLIDNTDEQVLVEEL